MPTSFVLDRQDASARSVGVGRHSSKSQKPWMGRWPITQSKDVVTDFMASSLGVQGDFDARFGGGSQDRER